MFFSGSKRGEMSCARLRGSTGACTVKVVRAHTHTHTLENALPPSDSADNVVEEDSWCSALAAAITLCWFFFLFFFALRLSATVKLTLYDKVGKISTPPRRLFVRLP